MMANWKKKAAKRMNKWRNLLKIEVEAVSSISLTFRLVIKKPKV